MSDIAFFTCEELIEELMTRETFKGIIICSIAANNEHKEKDWPIYYKLEEKSAVSILERAADHFRTLSE